MLCANMNYKHLNHKKIHYGAMVIFVVALEM